MPEHHDTSVIGPAASTPPPPPGGGRRRRLGELLVDAGVVTQAQLDGALEESLTSERIGDTLQRLGLADEHQIAQALGTQLGLEVTDLNGVTPDPLAIDRIPARLAERHALLPLRLEDDVLTIVMADPSNLVALDDVRVAAGVRSVHRVVGVDSEVDRARRRAYRADAQQESIEEAAPPDEESDDDGLGDDQPIIRLVSSLISEAVAARASDIHVEPRANGVGVRLRVDGLLRETMHLPRGLGRQVTSRLKIMGSLDIAERRLPQDGRAAARVDGQTIDLRVSTMPTLHGETVVLRLLPQGATLLSLTDLGLPATTRQQLTDALERPQGLVLVTGPTGSGKTTTLYAGLAEVSDPTRNVLTLEDPVEVQLPGVNQTQVETRIGLTFARGLRHVLRQDPDVVLVGEIRDQETAQLAVEASFTGHLVLATLRTNDVASAVARLVDLGADAFLIASSLQLVLAQRLARKVCDHCAVPEHPDETLLERLGLGRDTGERDAGERDAAENEHPLFRRGEGCGRCEGAGTLGRVAITESLVVSPSLRELVVERAAERTLSHQARADGLVSLREEAATLARSGVITAAEAVRVTPDVS
ncbi:MAG: GspE/PulE family protein [Nitriliruptoraceae bacterium]